MALQTSPRTDQVIDRAVRTVRGGGVAVLIAGFSFVGWPTAAAASGTAVQAAVSVEPARVDNNDFNCRPHPGVGHNKHCPPPVIPEAPITALIPLTAGGLFAIAYFVTRRRNGVELAG
jgi:dienelactone hydrolase